MFKHVIKALEEKRWIQTLEAWDQWAQHKQNEYKRQIDQWSNSTKVETVNNGWKPREVYFLDGQDIDVEVEGLEKEIVEIWHKYQLSNNDQVFFWDKDDCEDFPILAKFLEDNGMIDRPVIIHWWW